MNNRIQQYNQAVRAYEQQQTQQQKYIQKAQLYAVKSKPRHEKIPRLDFMN